jgi:hypothetical protein
MTFLAAGNKRMSILDSRNDLMATLARSAEAHALSTLNETRLLLVNQESQLIIIRCRCLYFHLDQNRVDNTIR